MEALKSRLRQKKTMSQRFRLPLTQEEATEPIEVMDYGNISYPLIDLLTQRYELQQFTIITTNLTGQAIREKYGDRIADRLNEMMEKVGFTNPSYRTN